MFPFGLLALLVGYALAVWGYVSQVYWNAPAYRAAQHQARARKLLGPDEGQRGSPEQLEQAYAELLEAARLMPHVRPLRESLERLGWRFEARRLSLPRELRERAASVALAAQRVEAARAPVLVSGARERGWAPDQLLEGPAEAVRWASVGALVMVGVWIAWKLRG